MWLLVALLLLRSSVLLHAQLQVDVGDVGSTGTQVCAQVTCKQPPPGETCVQRNALTISATAAYGEKRTCCPVWACTLPNGTTALHYGMTARGLKLVKDEEPTGPAKGEDPCLGVVCLPGSPSPNCRRYSPPEVSEGVMGVATDCCPLWTCTFPSNGSLYYVHTGASSLSRYWSSSTTTFDLVSMTSDNLTSLPTPTTTPPPKGMLAVSSTRNTAAILLTILTSELDLSAFQDSSRADGLCTSVTCYPSRGPSCAPVPPNNDLAPLLAIRNRCCPLYSCKTTTGRFLLLFFGMFHSDNFTTTTPDMSALSTTPSIPTTTPTTLPPTTTPPQNSTSLATTPPTNVTTLAPSTTSLETTTAASPTPPSTTALQILTTTPYPPMTTTPTPPVTTTPIPPVTTTPTPPVTTTQMAMPPSGMPVDELTLVVDDYEELEENGEPALLRSTSPLPVCAPILCYPSPSPSKCRVAPPADCTLKQLLAPALPCCPSYVCQYASGPQFQFGASDGVAHTVVSSPVQPTNDSTCPAPSQDTLVDYLRDCHAIRCLRPPGVPLTHCQKLPVGGGVPGTLRSAGVLRTCCGAWKCHLTGSRKTLYYGVIQRSSQTFIPFEFNGTDAVRATLPTSLRLRGNDAPPSTCPDIICAPPILAGAFCKPADPSTARRLRASLKRKSLCCPVWECTRSNSLIYVYGRMLSSGYANVTFKSVLHSNFFASEEVIKVKEVVTEVKEPQVQKNGKNTFAIDFVEEEVPTPRSAGILRLKKKNKEQRKGTKGRDSSSEEGEEEKGGKPLVMNQQVFIVEE